MGKIVIPKHSADINEMNAVFEIYIETKDWIDSKTYKTKLMAKIGAEQYPSSYPKKAHIPLYFGFLVAENFKSSARRKITKSGIDMYNAIKSHNIQQQQKILLESLENTIFGRNNFGCVSSDSDLDAPCACVRAILDLGYITNEEYSYLIWNIADNGKKYYETIRNIRKERVKGEIISPISAKLYKDWKPILALERWNFLKRDKDGRKMKINPIVLDKYFIRLKEIKIFNIDKHCILPPIIDNYEEKIANKSVFKPFIVSNLGTSNFTSKTIVESNNDLELQNIHNTDEVLLIDSKITKLLAYRAYEVNIIEKNDNYSTIKLIPRDLVNKDYESNILNDLRAEVKNRNISNEAKLIHNLFDCSQSKQRMLELKNNIEIEPVNLFMRLLTSISSLKLENYAYILNELLYGNSNYSDIIEKFLEKNNNRNDFVYDVSIVPQTIKKLIDYNIVKIDENNYLAINSNIILTNKKYFSVLPIYISDIITEKFQQNNKDTAETVKCFKYSKYLDSISSEESIKINTIDLANQEIFNNDNIIITDEKIMHILSQRIYQVNYSKDDKYAILKAKQYIAYGKEQNLLKELKNGNTK